MKTRRTTQNPDVDLQQSGDSGAASADSKIVGRHSLPPVDTMLRAVRERDCSFEGIFYLGVKTTGIFCRPGCPARTPRPQNIVFFPSASEALISGFRACRRCHPLERVGIAPDWLRPLLERVETEPTRRFRDADLRDHGLTPERVRRWFLRQHGMTFHSYQRSRRLGRALGELHEGADILGTGFEHGFESASGFAEALARITGTPPGASRSSNRIFVARIPSPLGTMVAAATDRALWLLEFADRRMLETQFSRVARLTKGVLVPGTCDPIVQVQEELDRYFAGSSTGEGRELEGCEPERCEFQVPIEIAGTPFQEEVWRALQRIPPGKTRSYAELAEEIGRPTAIRAVGRANGDNRLAIIVPCHRVIGANGALTGYGGGLWRKQRLLELEGARVGS